MVVKHILNVVPIWWVYVKKYYWYDFYIVAGTHDITNSEEIIIEELNWEGQCTVHETNLLFKYIYIHVEMPVSHIKCSCKIK